MRILRPSAKSTPLMRVYALKGTNAASAGSSARASPSIAVSAFTPAFSVANRTIERPSGVSSASEEK